MKKVSLTFILLEVVTIFALILTSGAYSEAQMERVLHNFGAAGDGASPLGGVVFDNRGNLYGTTPAGGPNLCPFGCGIVFALTPNLDGSWSENVLFDFEEGGTGFNSNGPLIFDRQGNLYGMANCSGTDCGSPVVYKLSPGSGGAWTESVLYSLGWQQCGTLNCTGLSFDDTGRLYGTTRAGGTNGTLFVSSQVSSREWHEVLIHIFYAGTDGLTPNGPLVFDAGGNGYGTTSDGGSSGLGRVFAVKPGNRGWTDRVVLQVLYVFRGGTDGAHPNAGVVFDPAGYLYGVTVDGGTAGLGTVYELTSNPDGSWSENILYSFQGNGDAAGPNSPLSFDTAGNLYGSAGGGAYGHGAVFKLTPSSNGHWMETVVYSFTGGVDGGGPSGGVILDAAGNLYGTTRNGGAYPSCDEEPYCGGVVYKITP